MKIGRNAIFLSYDIVECAGVLTSIDSICKTYAYCFCWIQSHVALGVHCRIKQRHIAISKSDNSWEFSDCYGGRFACESGLTCFHIIHYILTKISRIQCLVCVMSYV